MKVRDVRRKLEEVGWVYHHTTGDHHIYKKPGERFIVSIPGHDRDEVKPGTLNDIRRKSGVTL